MLRLVISHDDRVRTVPLTSAKVTIGADAGNDVVVDCRGVSRRHATMTRLGESILVEDLGSKNGLLVNGRRVDRVELGPGDIVQIGRAIVRLEKIGTGDADLAIRLEDRSSTHGALGAGITDSHDVSTEKLPMRWVRAAEMAGDAVRGARRREFLRSAREAVGADAILLCHFTRSGELAIDEVDGSGTFDDDLTALPATTGAPPLRAIVRGPWTVIPLVDGSVVGVHRTTGFPDHLELRAFLEFVALRLFTGGTGHQDAAATEDEALIFPGGYVRGDSPAMQALHATIANAAQSDLRVLLRGENGTGKELVARILHASSAARGPFRAVNCAAIPATLLEAELFGVHRRVATGVDPRPGLFVAAAHGTVFLDEIGDLPLDVQPKLLRVLQEQEVLPLGTSVPVKVDARVIASTNRDLEAMIAAGTFRRDLYYRLAVLEIRVPALRERRDDMHQLVTEILPRIARQHRKRIHGVSRKALAQLVAYDWPGNIRELENALSRAVSSCPNGGTLESAHFADQTNAPATPTRPSSLQSQMEVTEREALLDALKRAKGNKSEAARLLGITRAGLYQKLARHGLE